MLAGRFVKTLILLCAALFVTGAKDKSKPYIESLHATTDIKYHFATTLVTSVVRNPFRTSHETTFDITLPNEAFISNFTMEIDGTVYPGSVKEREEAKKEYERTKKKGQSAGHLASRPRETNKFRVQVNIAAGSYVVFNLTYQEILRRTLGIYESVLYIDPGQPVQDMKVQVYIKENRPLSYLRVPPLKDHLLSYNVQEQNKLVTVERPSPTEAYILFQPSPEDQTAESGNGISALFTVRYDVHRKYDAGDLLVSNGYFVHSFAPKLRESIPKDIIFILDRSGSMGGTKMFQLKSAMRLILSDLRKGDRFNIIMFSSGLTMWKTTLVNVTKSNTRHAFNFLGKVTVGGYTNIDKALHEGLTTMAKTLHNDSLPVVLFLSDGQATTGEKVPAVILNNAFKHHRGSIPIYSLAFGKDADWKLSKKLSLQSGAVARRIYEDDDADLQMTNFYREISRTLLSGVRVQYPEDQVVPGSVTTSQFRHFFEGSEMVVAGKLTESAMMLSADIQGKSISGPVNLKVEHDLGELPSAMTLTSGSDTSTITEKMWAYITIKQMMKKLEGTEDPNIIQELRAKAAKLSLKYKFVTPFSSMAVSKPDKATLWHFEQDDFGSAAADRDDSGYAGGDPHFMVSVKSMPYPMCFDIKGRPGSFYRLLKDRVIGLSINTNMQEGISIGVDGKLRTLMTSIVIQYKKLVVVVSTDSITIGRGKQLYWGTHKKEVARGNFIEVNDLSLRVELDFGVDILLSKLIMHNEKPARIDFLNIEIKNEHVLSSNATGLLGQFAHRGIRMKEVETPYRRVMADLWIARNGNIIARGHGNKRTRQNFVLNENRTCIDVELPTELFQTNAEKFVIPNLKHH